MALFQTSTNVIGTLLATTSVTTRTAVLSAPVTKDTSSMQELTVQV